jgi:hypothetical protein
VELPGEPSQTALTTILTAPPTDLALPNLLLPIENAQEDNVPFVDVALIWKG